MERGSPSYSAMGPHFPQPYFCYLGTFRGLSYCLCHPWTDTTPYGHWLSKPGRNTDTLFEHAGISLSVPAYTLCVLASCVWTLLPLTVTSPVSPFLLVRGPAKRPTQETWRRRLSSHPTWTKPWACWSDPIADSAFGHKIAPQTFQSPLQTHRLCDVILMMDLLQDGHW